MSGASVDIRIDDKLLQSFFSRLASQTDDMSDIFAEIGELLMESTPQRFENQADPEGNRWEDIKEETKLRKGRDDILIDEGYLVGSFAYQESAESLIFGSNLKYAATHQFGADDRHIKARPFLGISADDHMGIHDILVTALQP